MKEYITTRHMAKDKDTMMWVLALAVAALIVWVVYQQGYFSGTNAKPSQSPGVFLNY